MSNGMAERFVQTVKNTLRKTLAEGKSLQESLRAIRSTPVSVDLPSPAVLLQSRNLRGSLPFFTKSLQYKTMNHSVISNSLCKKVANASSQKPGTSSLPILEVNQRVRVRVGGRWIPGAVKLVCSQPNSCGAYERRSRISTKSPGN